MSDGEREREGGSGERRREVVHKRGEKRGSFALQQPSTNQIEAMAVWRSVLGEVRLLPLS